MNQEKIQLSDEGDFTSFDGRTFPSLQWRGGEGEPELVVIGVHGINGAAEDWHVLGEYLQENAPGFAVYSYNLRGMGRDPVERDRGFIRDAGDWEKDLLAFHHLIRQRHPSAKIVWFGESLGSLIVMRTLDGFSGAEAPCDAVGLSAPITGIRDQIPRWKEWSLRTWAFLFPRWRISLESLGDGGKVEVVEGVDHTGQAATNEWHVPRHTLRLLVAIGDESIAMPARASRLGIPCLVMHGGQDIFTPAAAAESFAGNIPEKSGRTYKFYPESFHLLFYGANNQVICRDVTAWLRTVAEK